jgi:glycosyltransferase involved in cell wall biosynthesis
MLLSIIVPSFNQGRFISRTLDSILGQDYRPLEVIVVDGASTDDTLEILRQYAARHPELRWLSERDSGPADAVNKGLALARGDVAAIQSSDDIYHPGAFSAVMSVFSDNTDCGFVIGHYQGIDQEDRAIYTEHLPEFSWEAYFGLALCIPQSSIFFRTSVARGLGGWNGKYYACDVDYWLRLLLRTHAIRIDRVLSGWRIHAGGRTHSGQRRRIWDGYWQMIEDNDAELAIAGPRVRRLARASRHVLAMRFYPSGNRWAIRWHLLLGLLQHPGWWRYQKTADLMTFLPGYLTIRWVYRAAKRHLSSLPA